MAVTHHDEHVDDHAAMLAVRAALASSAPPPLAPESRPGFDELLAKTPTAAGVVLTPGQVADVPGWWCRPSTTATQSAILYFHGGAYVLGSAAAFRGFASQIACRVGAAVFVADYALAPERPFPAAFNDMQRAFQGLRRQGFKKLAFAGDSAGGGLALALLLHPSPERPVAAAVFSPWIDLSLAGTTMETRAGSDPLLSREAIASAADQYLNGANPLDPRVCALAGDFASMPPVRIDVGDDEVLLDDSLRFDELARSAGAACDVHVWKGMVHVFPSNITVLKAAGEALDHAGAFLREALGRVNEGCGS